MVQILPAQPTFLTSMLGALGESLPQIGRDLGSARREKLRRSEEEEALERLGLPRYLSKLPDVRKSYIEDLQRKKRFQEEFGVPGSQFEETIVDRLGPYGVSEEVAEESIEPMDLETPSITRPKSPTKTPIRGKLPSTYAEFERATPGQRDYLKKYYPDEYSRFQKERDLRLREQYRPKKPEKDIFRDEELKMAAKKKPQIQEDIIKLRSQLSTLDFLEKESKELGVWTPGKAFSQRAAEFDATALTAIEPILKLFNPVGPLPEVKIKRVTKQFAPKLGELPATRRGKIAALKRFNESAIKNKELYLDYIERLRSQGRSLSKEEEDSLYNAFELEFDTIEKEERAKLGMEDKGEVEGKTSPKKLPAHKEGKVIIMKDGKRYQSKGGKWVLLK